MNREVKDYLNQLLTVYWLRPETALWRTLDCLLMHQESPKGKGVDFGCGTGLLSYILAGGRVSHYDDYMNVSNLVSFSKGADIYNSKATIKPVCDDSDLRYNFFYGIDHKKGLIGKAKQLKGFYKHTLCQDLNKPLPFENNSLDWGVSNVLYWLNDVQQVLKEWGRTIKRTGRLYLFVPNQHFKDKAWLYYKAPHKGNRAYLNYFDRGYNSLIHHYYSQQQWDALFKKSGFRVLTYTPYLSNPVMDIWNIGLRPISHLIIDMASRLKTSDRNEVKKEWIMYFSNFFMPILEDEFSHRKKEKDCAFHFFILENNL